jgi:SMC interacting uncharacterized protein involved in chromosome segregation
MLLGENQMFVPTANEEEFQTDTFHILSNLEQESKQLQEEKANLINIEAKLQAKISEEIETIEQKNIGLRKEVDDLKRRCEELTQVLNKQATER